MNKRVFLMSCGSPEYRYPDEWIAVAASGRVGHIAKWWSSNCPRQISAGDIAVLVATKSGKVLGAYSIVGEPGRGPLTSTQRRQMALDSQPAPARPAGRLGRTQARGLRTEGSAQVRHGRPGDSGRSAPCDSSLPVKPASGKGTRCPLSHRATGGSPETQPVRSRGSERGSSRGSVSATLGSGGLAARPSTNVFQRLQFDATVPPSGWAADEEFPNSRRTTCSARSYPRRARPTVTAQRR